MWPHWPATPISYRAKTDKWILLLSGSNFPFLLVDKQNREFFPEKFFQGVEMSFFKNVNHNVHRWCHIAFRKKIIWALWDKFSQKNSQKEKIWATQKQNSFVGFCSVWNGRGRLIWSYPFLKFENICASKSWKNTFKIWISYLPTKLLNIIWFTSPNNQFYESRISISPI